MTKEKRKLFLLRCHTISPSDTILIKVRAQNRMPALTFNLSAHDVAAGVQKREAVVLQNAALRAMPTRPLVAPKLPPLHAQTSHSRPDLPSVTMRFAPAPRPMTMQQPVPLSTSTAGLTFASLMAAPTTAAVATASLVERLAPQPVADVAAGFRRAIQAKAEMPIEDCIFLDQYDVPIRNQTNGCGRCLEVAYATMFRNIPEGVEMIDGVLKITNGKVNSPLLGLTGHVERFPVWSHIFGSVLFATYAVVRHVIADDETSSGTLASAAAWVASFTFACSSLYHATSPDRELSTFTRVVDYLGIYIGIVVTALADISVVTHGFRNVPVIAILDIPIGAVAISLFFIWRRVRIPRHVTWQSDRASCTIGFGLFQTSHWDQHHAPLREATTFLLSLSYFLVVPAAVETLGSDTAIVVLSLQAAGFLLLVVGMILDRILGWPDSELAEGRLSWLACQACKCVLNTHSLWHIIAIVAAVVGAVAREYALATI